MLSLRSLRYSGASDGMQPSGAAARRLLAACLSALALAFACVSPAQAAVTHKFLPEPSTALGEGGGVPVGCGVGASEPPCISGKLNEINSLTVDSGRVWVADSPFPFHDRIDGFSASSPWGFLAPQLDDEGGVTYIGSGSGDGVAVGGPGGEQQVYTSALSGGQEVVGVYGAASGKLLATWTGARTATGSFTEQGGVPVGSMQGVAVDRSSNPLSAGDVYVATSSSRPEFNVVDVFAPPGVGGGEPEAVATLKGTCASPGTACPGEEIPFVNPKRVAVSPVNGDLFVVDGSVIDVFEPGPLHGFVFVRQLTGPPHAHFEVIRAVAVDGGSGSGSGDLYVLDSYLGLLQFSEAGAFLGRVTGTSPSSPFTEVRGLGVDAASHDVYVAEQDSEAPEGEGGRIDVFGPDVVLADVETAPASGVGVNRAGEVSATLHGTVDPFGEGEAKCEFLLGRSTAFGEPSAPCEPEGVNGSGPQPVYATVKLLPDAAYTFRLQASNKNGVNSGEAWQDQSFLTPGPGIHSESVSSVSATSATLQASVDPNHAATSVYFQYSANGSTSNCEASPQACSTAPAAPGEALPAGGGSDEAVEERLQGLAAGSTYHYRVVVLSELEVEAKTFALVAFYGPDRTFITQPSGSGLGLPDGRAWELVSPQDKHGATFVRPGTAGMMLASASGGMATFPVQSPTEAGAPGVGSGGVQVLWMRAGAGGWSSRDISTPHKSATAENVGEGLEYRAFSSDLASGLVEPQGLFTTLAPNVFPPDTERTPYVRHDTTCASEPATCYEPLLTGAEGYADVAGGVHFGGVETGTGANLPKVGEAKFIGASPNLKHVIVATNAGIQLTKTPTPPKVRQLYEWSAEKPPSERLELVSQTEANQPAANTAVLGYEGVATEANGRGAVSRDGSRVFWAERNGGLYVRDVVKEVSLRLDTVQGGTGSGPVGPVFQGASADGIRVFFTDTQQLTAGSGAAEGAADLYVCEILEEAGGGLRCELKDLTPAGTSGEKARLQGVVSGFSSDGSFVYFVADGVLGASGGEGARPGECEGSVSRPGVTCNLYVVHHGAPGWQSPRLVAVLSGEDAPDWGKFGGDMAELLSNVSASGEWLAFMSDRELTGYDNRDALSGKPDEEVFLYHAATGRVVCVSCNRTGARPVGVEYGKVVATGNTLIEGKGSIWHADQWFAASVPGYDQYEKSRALYQPRYLSDQGRVFFDSSDGLAPQDTNGNQSVYEYEPVVRVAGEAGAPPHDDCTTSSATYSADAQGCIGLVSSGTATGESVFIDASESGNDVFFLTFQKLTGQDIDTALDMYDAHVCTSESPCLSEAAAQAPCTSADACRSAPSPEPEVFGAPASTAFSTNGNLPAPPPAASVKAKAKPLTRAQKLARALKACRKDRNRRKRSGCERKVRKGLKARGARKANRGGHK